MKQYLLILVGLFCGLGAGFPMMRAIIKPTTVLTVATVKAPNALLYGWALPPNTTLSFPVTEANTIVHYRTNSKGWKDVEHSFEKRAKRILIIGDSMTFALVPIKEQFSRLLQKNIGIETIAMGIGGWGTDQELEAYQHEGYRYDADLIILQFCSNDLLDNIPGEAIRPTWNKPFKYLLSGNTLQRISFDPATPSISLGASQQEMWNLMEALLIRFNGLVISKHSQFAVFCESVEDQWQGVRCYEKIKRVCERNRITFISSRSKYSVYKHNQHPDPLGNQQIAEDLTQFVRTNFFE